VRRAAALKTLCIMRLSSGCGAGATAQHLDLQEPGDGQDEAEYTFGFLGA
jgi:hypothetical protein